jgi:membrane protein required for colicin V production
MHVNELDLLMMMLLFVSGMIGILRGFVKEVLQLASLAIAIFCAFVFRKHIIFLFGFIGSAFIKEIISGIFIFILMFILGSIVVYLICQTIKMQGFGKFIDRLLGFSYGVLRGSLVVMFAVMLVEKNITINSHNWWKNSALLTKVQLTSKNLSKSIPHSWKDKMVQITE